MLERLGNSCGAAGMLPWEEQINWRSALVGSMTLACSKTVSMEGDSAGRELHSEKLPGLPCTGEDRWGKWGGIVDRR